MMPQQASETTGKRRVRREAGMDCRKWAARTLTDRERDCLRHVAAGYKETEIGAFLGISLFTVRFHIGNACRKLEAPTRCAAVYRAVKCALI